MRKIVVCPIDFVYSRCVLTSGLVARNSIAISMYYKNVSSDRAPWIRARWKLKIRETGKYSSNTFSNYWSCIRTWPLPTMENIAFLKTLFHLPRKLSARRLSCDIHPSLATRFAILLYFLLCPTMELNFWTVLAVPSWSPRFPHAAPVLFTRAPFLDWRLGGKKASVSFSWHYISVRCCARWLCLNGISVE